MAPWHGPNKVQLHHRHVKSFHMVKRLQKLVQYIRRYSTKYDKPRRNAISIRLFSTETTGAIYTKILTLVVLFNHAYAWRYPISFLNARATKMRSLPFFHKIGCHGNVPWDIEKRCPDRSSAPKRLKRLRKLVQYIRRFLTKYAEPDENTQRNFHLLSCSLPKLLDQSSLNYATVNGKRHAICQKFLNFV